MNLITVMSGGQQWDGHSSKLIVFYVKQVTDKHAQEYPTNHPIAQQALNRTNVTRRDAKPGHRADIYGEWMTSTYEVAEGAILKFAGRKHTGVEGAPFIQGSIFLAVRERGPLQRISMALSAAGAVREAEISGRFDVLTYADMKARGLRVAPALEKFHEPLAVRTMFRVEMIEPEIPSPTITTRVRMRSEKGEEVTFVRNRKKRAFKL